MENENILIKVADNCSMKDSNSQQEIRPKGFVEIYTIDENGIAELAAKSNLVVLQGRQLIGQSLTNVANTSISYPRNGEYIYWLGLGTGGASIGNPLSPVLPLITDTALYTEIPFSTSVSDSTACSDWATVNSVAGFYKWPLGGVQFNVDPSNSNAYLITQLSIVVSNNYALGYSVNEAGLFTCSSNALNQTRTGPGTGQFHLFARITFPSVTKTNTRQLSFLWYLYT
jgi:hypothetical protein